MTDISKHLDEPSFLIRNNQTGRYAETRPYDGSVDWWAASSQYATAYSYAQLKPTLDELFPDGNPEAYTLIDLTSIPQSRRPA